MPTLTIRNLSAKTVKSLKELAQQNHRSMEQEVRNLIEGQTGDRAAAITAIRAAWERQSRRPKPSEIDKWIAEGRR